MLKIENFFSNKYCLKTQEYDPQNTIAVIKRAKDDSETGGAVHVIEDENFDRNPETRDEDDDGRYTVRFGNNNEFEFVVSFEVFALRKYSNNEYDGADNDLLRQMQQTLSSHN